MNKRLVHWRLHLRSSPVQVFDMLSTDTGRARFWAESAIEGGGRIHFIFPNGQTLSARIIDNTAPSKFAIEYMGGTVVTFEVDPDGSGGTNLRLTDSGVSPAERTEVAAGWASVLLALKGAVDYGVDLRNHDGQRTWDQGFVDN